MVLCVGAGATMTEHKPELVLVVTELLLVNTCLLLF